MIGVKLHDITGWSDSRIRGVEIYEWLNKNVPWDIRKKNEHKYAILDDDSDMLLWQKDHFFQTSFKTGITEEIVEKVIEHLGREE